MLTNFKEQFNPKYEFPNLNQVLILTNFDNKIQMIMYYVMLYNLTQLSWLMLLILKLNNLLLSVYSISLSLSRTLISTDFYIWFWYWWKLRVEREKIFLTTSNNDSHLRPRHWQAHFAILSYSCCWFNNGIHSI